MSKFGFCQPSVNAPSRMVAKPQICAILLHVLPHATSMQTVTKSGASLRVVIQWLSTILMLLIVPYSHANKAEELTATTVNADAVILHPNGSWGCVDTRKVAEAKTKRAAIESESGYPSGTRPGFFGIGRCVAKDHLANISAFLGGKGW